MARDRFRYFRIEARELLEHLGQGVLDLEKTPPAAEMVARLLRFAHTLKGAARVVKRQDIAEQAHAVEDALTALPQGSAVPVPRERIDHLLALLDDIAGRMAMLTPSTAAPASGGAADSEELFRAFRPEMHEMDGLLGTMSEAHAHVTALRPLLGRMGRAKRLTDLVLDHFTLPAGPDNRSVDRTAHQRTRALTEDLLATIGRLEQDLTLRVDDISREFEDARGAAERLRLVPATAVFRLLERTMRDTAQTLGKSVSFEGRGGDVRLDAHVLGVVQGALLQVIRNAVAHGIESAAERTAAGKLAEGRVTIDVRRRGQSVVFSCADDGRGIDLESIRRIAQHKGLSPAATDQLKPEDVVNLLLKGGISTSNTVTALSGRGVGLDVVREAAERLGGDVSVRTTRQGTTIDLIVPLTLSSLPGLLVEASGVTAILPLDAVRGALRVTPQAIVRVADRRSVMYDGQAVPFASLAQAVVPHAAPAAADRLSSAVIVQGRTSMAIFSVDRIVGIRNIVVRPLPDLAPAAPYVVGASLADGAPEIVLDPEGLVAAADGTVAMSAVAPATRPTVLVIDDSLTTRMLEQTILESAGYAVDLAVSGEDALVKARDGRYALFLVDVEMPGMDGFAFIERVRTDPALRDIPSILVTSRSADDDLRRGAAVGAEAYIVKSEFNQGVLLEHIRRLVG
jgi:two-component system chemotaxis sensor kinase CheA